MGIEEGRDLVSETFKAFKAGLKGKKYENPYVPPNAVAEQHADRLDRVAKLHQLHQSGALTDDEFENEKAKLLSQG